MTNFYQETSSRIIFQEPEDVATRGAATLHSPTDISSEGFDTGKRAYVPQTFPDSTNETVGGKLHEEYYSITEEQSLIDVALQTIGKAENPDVAKNARRLVLIIDEILLYFRQSGFSIGFLPKLSTSIVEDGSVLVEWIFDSFRVGFSIEPDEKESGWYLVTNRTLGDISASGHTLDVDINKLILWLLNFVISYS
ncbi:MAG: hypothetical protein ACTSPB_24235 [Candidatus Thorarchaeota archaeon]